MQTVVNRIDENVEFIILNGDKKWFMYELILGIHQSLYEFSVYLTGNPSLELTNTLNDSKSKLDTTNMKIKISDLQPSRLLNDLYLDFTKNQNQNICDKTMEMIKFRESFNKYSNEVFKLRNMMIDGNKQLRKDIIRYNGHGIDHQRDRKRNYKDFQRSLKHVRTLQDRYLSSVAEFERLLADGHENFNFSLNMLTKVHEYYESQFVRVVAKEFYKMRKGLSRFVKRLLRTREELKRENYMLDKNEKLNKVHDIYNHLSKKKRNFQLEMDWPPFQKEIDRLNLEDNNDIKKIHSSFSTLIEAFDHYFTRDIEINSAFFDILDRIETIDPKMSKALETFNETEYRCDHPYVDKILKNFAEIKNNFRKISVKCFGAKGANSRHLRLLLEEKIKYREFSYKSLDTIKKRLKGYGNEYNTEEFWSSMAFKFYDYINRIFVKSSSINIDFLRKYDQSLNYTCNKLANIIELLKQNENICINKKLRKMDLSFKETCFERKKDLAVLFPSILIDDRLLMQTTQLPRNQVKFHFFDSMSDIVVRLPAKDQVMVKSLASPVAEVHSAENSSFVRFPPEIKNNPENQTLVSEMESLFKYGISPQDSKYKYDLIAKKFVSGMRLEDFINIIMMERPITVGGKTYKNFPAASAAANKNELMENELGVPNLKIVERTGFGKNKKYSVVKQNDKIKMPFGKGYSVTKQTTYNYILNPKRAISAMKIQSDDIPGGKYLTINIISDIKEASRGLNIEVYLAFVWESKPFLGGVVETFGKKQATFSANGSVNLIERVFKENSSYRPDSKVDMGGPAHAMYEEPLHYTEDILKSREKRAKVLNEFEEEKFEFEKMRNMEALKARNDDDGSGGEWDFAGKGKGQMIMLILLVLVLLKIWADQHS